MLEVYQIIVAIFIVVITITCYFLFWKEPKIGKPTNLQISNVTYDSINLEWTKPTQGGSHVTSYTIFCRSNDDQWQSKWSTTKERVIAHGLKAKTRYIFKVRPECGDRHGEESDSSEPTETRPKVPGKPRHRPIASCITQDSVILRWHEPVYGADLVKRYSVFYQPTQDSHGEWKKLVVEGTGGSLYIGELDSGTRYTFKVCPEGEFGPGPESDSSFPIKTHKLLAECRKKQSKRMTSQEVLPAIYALPLNYIMKQTEGGRNIAKCVIGESPTQSVSEKVLMLVGATGAGKTTLLNGIANYILGVRLEDSFRFKIDTAETSVNQAHSQTTWITAYTFYPVDGSRLPYPLTIIDTPGFGDTRGIRRDKEIVDQLREFFSTTGEHGIDHLNGVGFVTQASLPRLTPTQKYIFESILGIFGNDISSNMFLMTTFSDGKEPPVLSAIKAAEIPHGSVFSFNNSALFAKPTTDGFNRFFWELGMESFSKFFNEFRRADPVSTRLMKEVLMERQRLDALLQGLQDKISTGLDKINELYEVEKVLKENEDEMQISENFTYEVKVNKRLAVKLPSNQKALNCHNCFTTCHYPCDREQSEMYNCLVMNERGSNVATCNICPSRCLWNNHTVESSRYESFKGTEKHTIKELKARYDKAYDCCNEVKEIIDRLEEELKDMQQDVMNMIQQARQCKQRLNEISLKSGKLTEVGYIDLLIRTEKIEKRDGYLERIEALEELKKAAEILTLPIKGVTPTKGGMKSWWTGFQRGKP